ncbi:MAG TPA: methyltransferase type 12 [Gemmatimonadetes bacterium]|nr:methyltransferase type 12 [Gemmatimonadota bacterium]
MTYEYVGTELDLFAQATNWKKYLQSVVSPFLTGDVLEVGAGIGTTTRAFSDGSASTWLCLEPDGDLAERARAQTHLRPDGHLVVIGPAHQWLFSEFDEAAGHFRRYPRASLRAVVPPGMDQVMLRYMDALCVALSAANRVLLRASTPTVGQIKTWNSAVPPLSRLVDPLLFWRAGKSVVGVWRQR